MIRVKHTKPCLVFATHWIKRFISCIYLPSMHLSIHKEMVPSKKPELPSASFQGFRDYFDLFWVWQVSKERLQPLCLCFSVLSSPHTRTNHFTSHSAHGNSINCRRLLNLTTAVHHEPVNHLPYQLSIFWALLLTRLAKKSSVGQLKLSRWRLGSVRNFMIASW